jgi:hypothetical protein
MTIRKSLAQVEAEGQVLADGTLVVYVSFIEKDPFCYYHFNLNL